MVNQSEVEFVETIVPMDFNYNIRAGKPIEDYLRGMAQKKIMGSKCTKCGKVVIPPRNVCGVACGKMEMVEVDQTGTLQNYTIGHVKITKGLMEPVEEPVVLGMIQLDGTNSLLVSEIRGVDPKQVKKGLRVKAVWKESPEGKFDDLAYFELAS